jgi:hypothetical protein
LVNYETCDENKSSKVLEKEENCDHVVDLEHSVLLPDQILGGKVAIINSL